MGSPNDNLVRAIGKSGLLVFVGMFLELGISFLAKLIIARQLTTFSYGEVAIGLTVLTVLGIVTRLGLQVGVARIGPRYEGAARRGVYISALSLQIAVSFVVLVLLYVGSSSIATLLGNPGLDSVLRIIAFGVPAPPLMRLSIGILRAEDRTGPKVIVQNIVKPISRIALVAFVLLVAPEPWIIALAYVSSNWIAAVLASWFAIRETTILDYSSGWDRKYSELLVFSVPLMLSTSMEFIIGYTDNFMIQYFVGSAAVGTYDISFTIGQTLTVALGAFSYLFLPRASSLHADGEWDQISHLYQLVTKWIIFMTLPVFLVIVLFSELVIRLTFGAEYIQGAPVLVLIALTYFFRAAMGPNKELLSAIGHTTYIMVTNGIMAATNILLNIFLIPAFGIVGAATASFVSFSALNLLYNYKLWREYGLSPISRSSVLPTGVFTVGVVGAMAVVDRSFAIESRLSVFAVALCLGALGYVLCILSLGGIESDDIMLLNSAEDRFGIDLESVKRVARRIM